MKNRKRNLTGRVLLFLSLTFAAQADVRLPGFFSDHMVLQRDRSVPIWGWAAPGERVTVAFAGQQASTVADGFGNWMIRLKPMPANAVGQALRVNHLTLEDLLVGEVWLASGTRNMDLPVRLCMDSRTELQDAEYPGIRLLQIPNVQSPLPENNTTANWQSCTKESAYGFSGVSFFFARTLHRELGVPVGVINASWGGTPIVSWIPGEGFRDTPGLEWAVPNIYGGRPSTEEGKAAWEKYLRELEAWLPSAKKAIAAGETPTDRPEIPTKLWITNIVPTKTFNGMINPLIPYAMRGVIWDHDEAGRSKGFLEKQRALITAWRKLWGAAANAPAADFAFYYVQETVDGKAVDQAAGGGPKAEIREMQRQGLDIERSGMVVSVDLGSENKRLPQNKQGIAERLSLWALAKEYGKTDLVYSGPLFDRMEIKGDVAQVYFDHVGSGLMAGKKEGLSPTQPVDTALKGFAVAGSDKVWHWAQANMGPAGESVMVCCDQVTQPVAVRYAYSAHPGDANLYNREGLPASPFSWSAP